MPKNEPRKAHTKLLRKEYEFPIRGELDDGDLQKIVEECDCTTEEPFEPEPPSPTQPCFSAEYIICGNSGVTATGPLDPTTKVYLQAIGSQVNPNYIYYQDVGLYGACFRKTGEVVYCDQRTGPLLEEGDYEVLVDDPLDPPCESDRCNVTECPWILYEICEEDPGYGDGGVPQTLSISSVDCLGSTSGPGFLCYAHEDVQHAYSKASLYCLQEPAEGSQVVEGEDCDKITETSSCEAGCECCPQLSILAQYLVEGIKERIRAENSGNLPYEWDDSEYILNLPATTVFGTENETPCIERYNQWLEYVRECHRWMVEEDFLFGIIGKWLNTDLYPGGNLDDVGTEGSITNFQATDYYGYLESGDSVSWFYYDDFRSFQTNDDDWYTVGGEGGFGIVDEERFLDSAPHVVVNKTEGFEAWCNLIKETMLRMLALVQKCYAMTADVSQSSRECREIRVFVGQDEDENCLGSCSNAVACANAMFQAVPWGNVYTYGYNGSCYLIYTEALNCADFGGYWALVLGSCDSPCGTADYTNIRSKIAYNISHIISGSLKVFVPLSSAFSVEFGQTPQPHSFGQDKWGEWTGHGISIGGSGESEYLPSSYTPNEVYCPSSSRSWAVGGMFLIVYPDFVV